MTANEILAVAEFLGDGISESHVDRLIDAARQLSVKDKAILYMNSKCIGCRKFHIALWSDIHESK